jgi:hypothetical protein
VHEFLAEYIAACIGRAAAAGAGAAAEPVGDAADAIACSGTNLTSSSSASFDLLSTTAGPDWPACHGPPLLIQSKVPGRYHELVAPDHPPTPPLAAPVGAIPLHNRRLRPAPAPAAAAAAAADECWDECWDERSPAGLAEMPAIGFGCHQLGKREAEQAVLDALAAGYRHVDTAPGYGNEEHVGRAVIRSGLAREEVWLTTKVQNKDAALLAEHGGRARLVAAIEGSLARLQVAHVDLLLVHSPCAHGIMRPGEPELRAAVWVGLGRIVALHHRSSTLYHIH